MCDTEIHDLYGTVSHEHDILGLYIAVDYSPVMGMLKRTEYLRCEMHSVSPFEDALSLDVLRESYAVDVLHYDVLELVGEPDIIYLYDILVREQRYCL